MDYIAILRDSIDTSVNLELFPTREKASVAHIFHSKLTKFPLIKCQTKLANFNPVRLQPTATKAYPIEDRPRGKNDIKSVKFYQKQIRAGKNIAPIWIIKKHNKYILLDGAHRIVASYIENQKLIYSYIIE